MQTFVMLLYMALCNAAFGNTSDIPPPVAIARTASVQFNL